jgi:hypothetical protein
MYKNSERLFSIFKVAIFTFVLSVFSLSAQ